MRFLANVIVIAIGLKVADFFMTSVSFANLASIFLIAILFTGVASLVVGYIRNAAGLFFLNAFIFYVLAEIFSEFRIEGIFSLLLLTFFVSIVETIFSSE